MKQALFIIAAFFILIAADGDPRTPIYQLQPSPADGQLIGAVLQPDGVTYKWGATSVDLATGYQSGIVFDTLSATGTYTVDLTVDQDTNLYKVFLTPVDTLGYSLVLADITDTSFTYKAFINDTAAADAILKVHWLVKE